MRLFEYQSKIFLKKYGISVPEGKIVANLLAAKQFMEMVSSDCILKAQVLSTDRSKTGGIKVIESIDEIESAIAEMFSLKIDGLPVSLILFEEVITYKDVFTLSIYIDQESAKPMVALAHLVNTTGIHTHNEKIFMKLVTIEVNPKIGLLNFQIRHLVQTLELPRELWDHFEQTIQGLWQLFNDLDVVYLEVNPLVLSFDNRLIALNITIKFDEYALFRQKELAESIDYSVYHPIEAEALTKGLSFIKLDGNIGCLANGAALSKATVDLIYIRGERPANYLDVGACASKEHIGAGFRLLVAENNITSVLLNYYGVLTPCDEIAAELIKTQDELNILKPVMVLFSGLNAKKGVELLNNQSSFKTELFINESSIITHGKD